VFGSYVIFSSSRLHRECIQDSLFRDPSDNRIIIRVRISHGLDKTKASIARIFAVLFITDLIDHEQDVDLRENPDQEQLLQETIALTHKIAGRSELLVLSKAVNVRAQELVQALYKICTFPVAEYVERVNPGARLCSCFSVVRVGCVFEGNVGKEVGNAELLEARHVERLLC
jgi:hypothetical protein